MKLIVTGGSGFIGTNLIDYLLNRRIALLNIDIKPPKKISHNIYWKECDILDKDELLKEFKSYNPTHVIHLAARTDTEGKTVKGYLSNTEGTRNVLEAIKVTKSVQRVIITSTQFVNQYKGIPKHEEDYAPHTIYGESKIITEQLTRKANLQCIWTLIRPTNIWGPWHPRYPREFWRVLGKGRYIHPGGKIVLRSYGYVNNVVYQINKIFESPSQKVNAKVFYVGDMPINLLDWVNGFSVRQIGRKVIIVPKYLVRSLAYLGDLLAFFSIKFPITISRYKSMTTSNDVPMKPTFDAFGMPPYSIEEGIEETIKWLKEYYPDLVKV